MGLFDQAFYRLLEIAELCNLDLKGTKLTLDSGFDSERNHTIIEDAEMIPVIKPNRRGTKNEDKPHAMFEKEAEQQEVYKQRHKIERAFAWEDRYRKTVTRYERRSDTHMDFKYLAYSLINPRWFLKRK
jgi:transposase